jgi:amino acid permease
MWGSMAIAVNSLTGPAMLDLPATFQRSGLIPTTVALIFVCILSALCSLHMANTISKVPGNLNFSKEVEFSEAFRYFWGHRWFVLTEVIFFCCVTCLNISSIVDTSQVFDTFVGHIVESGSIALHFSFDGAPVFVRWNPSECTPHQVLHAECLAFEAYTGGFLITLGYIVTAVIFFPMALMDLKENSSFQILGFIVLLGNTVQFSIEFMLSGLDWSNLSLWGTSWDTLFGVVLFNFALVIAIPSWLYERHPSVDVPTIIHGSSILSTVLYIIVGTMGALAIPKVSDNMLESMMSGIYGISMQLGASLFAFMIVGLGSPLFSVLTRMNLTGSGLATQRTGNMLAVYFPWGVSWMLYQGKAVTELLSWGGVIFTSAVAFLLPLVLALHTVLEFDQEGSIHVYGTRGWIVSRQAQIVTLIVLLSLAVVSVGTAVAGQF